ncbi:TPA: hypothetical protein JG819_004684 [Vibrio parahaemolyticus]|nr:hypothetical protein [Vibrio parahaemolyticus]HAV1545584.1 hypothetical protein [Vibrio parahaemolyticus]
MKEIKVKTIDGEDIDGELMPLCPFCCQPIFGGAIIVRHTSYAQMALDHGDCVDEFEDERDLETILELEAETTPLAPGAEDI